MIVSDAYFLYNEEQILTQLNTLKAAFPDFCIFYSAKTNPHHEVLKTLIEHGCGIDAASAQEVMRAKGLGLKSGMISYSAPGKTEEDIESALGSCTIVADSFTELRRLNDAACRIGRICDVGIRFNPGKLASQFGISPDEFLEKLPVFNWLRIIGIHCHEKSQILDAERLAEYFERVFRIAKRLTDIGYPIQFINFGSGFGVSYGDETPLNIGLLSRNVKHLIEKYQFQRKIQLIIEPGRFLVSKAGVYRTKIIDKKTSNGTTFLIASGGLSGFVRPCFAETGGLGEPLYSGNHPSEITVLNSSSEIERVTVTGNLCSAYDVFARNILLKKAEIGDFLEFSHAGAYGYTLSFSRFAGARTPKEYFRKTDGNIVE